VSDPRLERLAGILVDYSTRVGKGDVVVLDAPAVAQPLVCELYRCVLRAGGHPVPRISLDRVQERFFREASYEQLGWVNPVRVADLERADVRIAVAACENSKSFTSVDADRMATTSLAYQEYGNRFLERAARGEARWVVCAYPTHAMAQDAEMSLSEYEEFVYRGSLAEADDPVGAWEELASRLGLVEAFLNSRTRYRIVCDGTDLRFETGGRLWVPSTGRENVPDGEIFTGPVEESVEGTIRFTFPAVFRGREVDDVRLRFEGGEVVEATAGRGEDFLRTMIAMDDGARRVGEFAFGLNDGIEQFTRNTLFDEKIGGTVHLALGTSYPETGGVNKSALHWDMVCDLRQGGEVYADDELVYRDGAFLAGVLG
jgi:aminopeptidase